MKSMAPSGSSVVTAFVHGKPTLYTTKTIEIESSRRALALLRRVISPDQMEALLEEELRVADDKWREWAQSSTGHWKAAEVEFTAAGMSSAEFLKWWSTALEDVQGVMFPGFPEHYVFRWTKDPQGSGEPTYLIVEELGYAPFRMYCTFDNSLAPVAPADGFTATGIGAGRLKDGTEVVRFMNQVKDIPDGMQMKSAVFMGSAVPDYVVESHIEQQILEWSTWLDMAFIALKRPPSTAISS
jgi:hypothetical protein